MKTEGLRRRGIDHLPYIYAHAKRKELQFIDQRDIDATVDVLQQLGHLGNTRRRHTDRPREDTLVEHRSKLCGDLFVATHHLWNVVPRDRIVARIFALWRKGNIEDTTFRRYALALHLQPLQIPSLKERNQQLFGRTRVRRALQHYQLAFPNPRRRGSSR